MTQLADSVFRSLSDPTRRGLLERLTRHGEQTVWMLTRHSGVSQPAVSKHLGVLKRAGLVHLRHTGRETRYSAHPQGLAPLIDWLNAYATFWNHRFDRLESLLKGMEP